MTPAEQLEVEQAPDDYMFQLLKDLFPDFGMRGVVS